jgi:transposase
VIGVGGRSCRATGCAAAYKVGGWRPLLLKGERDWLLAQIAENPDLTLRGVMAELAARGTPASYDAVWRFFAREGIKSKKARTPANRIAPMSPAGGPVGRRTGSGFISDVWCSSRDPGLRRARRWAKII